jgi:hypothetical protein
MTDTNFPTEEIELPSKGLIYPKENPLSSGKIEMRYMTASDEDILTNINYIKNGTVIDKLLKALIVSKINYEDLITGDKNAILIAARVLGYGKDYEFTYKGKNQVVDLTTIDPKPIDESLYTSGKNEFGFELPNSGVKITFKFLTGKDEKLIEQNIKGYQKINKDSNPLITSRLKQMITSVNGDSTPATINKFVDTQLLAPDSRAFRKYYNEISPDIKLEFTIENSEGEEEVANIPIDLNFFWPESGV